MFNLGISGDFFRRPEFTGTLAGLFVAGVVLAMGTYWTKSVSHEQESRINFIQSEIKRLRPPNDTPETDWQKIMRQAGEKQRIFWGKKMILLINRLPERSWLSSLGLEPADIRNNRKKAGKDMAGLDARGGIYAPDGNLDLAALGDYILECLRNDELMANLQWWRIRSIVRTSKTQVDFDLLSPM